MLNKIHGKFFKDFNISPEARKGTSILGLMHLEDDIYPEFTRELISKLEEVILSNTEHLFLYKYKGLYSYNNIKLSKTREYALLRYLCTLKDNEKIYKGVREVFNERD